MAKGRIELPGGPPRLARARPGPLWRGRALFLLIFAGLPAALQWAIQVGDARLAALADHGLTTEGRVTDVPYRDGRQSLHYVYTVDGTDFHWRVGIAEDWAPQEPVPRVGAEIPVIYLPENPAKNVPISIERAQRESHARTSMLRKAQAFLVVVFGSLWVFSEYRTSRLVFFAERAATATGRILGTKTGLTASVRYEFEVPGKGTITSTSRMNVGQFKELEWVLRDPSVLIAYDPIDPSHSELWSALARTIELPDANVNA